MRKISIGLVLSLVAVMAFTFAAVDAGAADTIKIGFNIPLTGDNPDVGASSKNAAEMYLKKKSHGRRRRQILCTEVRL
jgi:branched-chain amino acid transport system substrate-binding protein